MLLKHIVLATMAASLAFSAGAETTPPSANLNVALTGEVPVKQGTLDVESVDPYVVAGQPIPLRIPQSWDGKRQWLYKLDFDFNTDCDAVRVKFDSPNWGEKGPLLTHTEMPDAKLEVIVADAEGDVATGDIREVSGGRYISGVLLAPRPVGSQPLSAGEYRGALTITFEPKL
ncbi:hypothetical protein [Pandoraea pulmonicola]|uniref:Fimbrial protein n=1 Tax=Pandoraea pulmonicola TaxID=93221 RepID=A0AAJ4ZB83_PANPU|nr:hypothetical protein [Pandoraea pulmonicola]AJC21267.1 hypothetical protein RO07_13645 [Pandoraea pulmonicola]SUA90031.1 Uncharacterised protein [Pandoraea pulmonicola]